MMTDYIEGTVKNGKFISFDNREFIKLFYRYEGERVVLSIKRWYKKRTINQNKYYWAGVVHPLAEFLGYTDDEFHEILKWKFLKFIDKNGIENIKSTSELDIVEENKYIENIRDFASRDFSFYLESPEEYKQRLNEL